jgi:hypothetical protein
MAAFERHAKIDLAASGALVTPGTSQLVRVTGYQLVAAGAVTAKFQSNTTDLTGAMSLITGTPVGQQVSGRPGTRPCLFKTAKGQPLNLTLGGAVQVSGHLNYDLEDA